MGTEITPARTIIFVEETQFRSAVSENLAQRLGGAINFINDYQHSEKQFFINGAYSIATLPQNAVDGLVVFQFDAFLIDAWMFNITAGSSGTTELDLKVATTSGGSFTSIFSTTPKITSAAGNNAWVGAPGGSYSPPAGCTQPVLSTTNIAKWSAIRVDLLQAQVDAENCGIILHYRPR